jgi:hypothetical protein
MALEICLIGLVAASYWIGNLRVSKGREAEEGFSLGFRGVSIVLLSVGFASMLVIVSTVRNGWRRNQPNAVGLGVLSIAMTVLSVESWVEYSSGMVGGLYVSLGIVLLILLICTIPMKGERWSVMLAVNAHIILIIGLISSGLSVLIPVFLVILSTIVWVTGILQLRKSLRAWGLADLVMAILCSVVFYGGVVFQSQSLLIGLSIVAVELGIISWLGLRNEDELVKS